MRMRSRRLLLAAAAATLLAPGTVRAQLRPGPGGFGQGGRGWTPIVGPRLGWSIRDSSPSLGARLRVPLPIPIIRPSIAAGGDLVFQSGLHEWQGTGDITLGVFAPLYFGGGPAVLNSVFEDAPGRQTKTGYTVVGGVRRGRTGPLLMELEFRWIRVAELQPRFLMISFGYPLLGGR